MKINRNINFKTVVPLFIFSMWMVSCGVFDPLDPYVNIGRWAASFGGSLEEKLYSAADDADSIYACGQTATFGAGNGDAWLIKTANNGTIVWQKAYNYGASTSETMKRIRLSADGNLTVLCDIADSGNQGFAVMNIDSYGSVSWYRLYDGDKTETASDCIKTPVTGDGYRIAGYINSITTSIDSSGFGDAFLLAVDGQGNFLWHTIYGGPNYDEARVLLQCSDGGMYIAGNTSSFGNRKSDYWIIKTDREGRIIWEKAFGGGDDEYLCSASVSSDGTLLLAGITKSSAVLAKVQEESAAYWIICLNGEGNIIWQKTYHDPGDTSVLGRDTICSVHESTIQDRYIFALSACVDSDGQDYCLLVLANDGSIDRQARYGGSASDQVREVVYMQDHSSLAVGSTRSFGGGNSDFWFLKALPNLQCVPLTKESGFVENAAGGAGILTSCQTRELTNNPLEKPNGATWTVTDTQCTIKTQAP